MELVHEYHLSSVAIPIIYTVKRGYPPDEGAHLALSNFSSSPFNVLMQDRWHLVIFLK
jgi:hypothetical protein